jgi:hypothetical protein
MYDTSGEYHLFDGKKWYRCFPPTNLQHPDKTSDEDNTTRTYKEMVKN